MAKAKLRCADWCGAGCTEAQYQRARRNGAALAKRLGKGWTFQVHENLGWHYKAVSPCGRLKVLETLNAGPFPRGYTALLGEPDMVGGQWAEHGKTAKAAVRRVVAVAQADLSRIAAMIKGL